MVEGRARPRPEGHICCFPMIQVTRRTEASRTMAFEKQCADSLPSQRSDRASAQAGSPGQAGLWKRGTQGPQLCDVNTALKVRSQVVGDAGDQPELSHPHKRESVADSKTSFSVSSPGDLRGRSHRGSELGHLGCFCRGFGTLPVSV